MNEKELKTKVNEYFEKYMMVSFDKFLENFNESLEWCRYKDKEIERLNNVIDELEIQLNSRVEIIEEDKKIKKLPYYSLKRIQKAKSKDEWREERIKLLEIIVDDYYKKINEIIDEVNKNKLLKILGGEE